MDLISRRYWHNFEDTIDRQVWRGYAQEAKDQ
jgi:hypothetical protein